MLIICGAESLSIAMAILALAHAANPNGFKTDPPQGAER
jgi:hypothetical protein